jgi:DNA-binding protein
LIANLIDSLLEQFAFDPPPIELPDFTQNDNLIVEGPGDIVVDLSELGPGFQNTASEAVDLAAKAKIEAQLNPGDSAFADAATTAAEAATAAKIAAAEAFEGSIRNADGTIDADTIATLRDRVQLAEFGGADSLVQALDEKQAAFDAAKADAESKDLTESAAKGAFDFLDGKIKENFPDPATVPQILSDLLDAAETAKLEAEAASAEADDAALAADAELDTAIANAVGINPLEAGAATEQLTGALDLFFGDAGVDSALTLEGTAAIGDVVFDPDSSDNDSVTLVGEGGENFLTVRGIENVVLARSDFDGATALRQTLILGDTTGVTVTLNPGTGGTAITGVDIADDNLLINNDVTIDGNLAAVDFISLGEGTDKVTLKTGGAHVAKLVDVENLVLSGSADTVDLAYNQSDLTIDGGAGTDAITLADGFNAITVTNIESITGSGASVDQDGDGIAGATGDGLDMVVFTNDGHTTTLQDVEIVLGGSGAEALTFTDTIEASDVIDLGGGNDSIQLAAGINVLDVANVETVTGTEGTDKLTFVSNLSGETIDLNGGGDDLTLAAGGNTATIQNAANVIAGDGVDNLTLLGARDANVRTGAGADVINASGSTGDNEIRAGLGDDTVTLGGGADTVVIARNKADPTIFEASTTGGETINSFVIADDKILFEELGQGNVAIGTVFNRRKCL